MKSILNLRKVATIVACLAGLTTQAHAQNVMLKQNFGGSDDERYYSVTAVSDGTVAVGYSAANSFNTGDWTGITGKGGYDAIIVKYNNAGTVVWKKNFGGSGGDYYNSVIAVSGGIIAVGYSESTSFNTGDWTGITGKGGTDAIIVKYDNNGNVLWKKNFGGGSGNFFNSVTAVSDGIIAVGSSYADSFNTGDWTGITGKGGTDAIIVKYDNNGNIVWKKNFGGSDFDNYNSVTAVSGGIIAVGNSGTGSFTVGDWAGITGKGSADAIIVKYDNNGNVVWKKNFGGSDYETFQSVTPVSDGVVAVGVVWPNSFNTGDWTGITGKGNYDAIIVKYDNTGNVVWKKNFGADNYDRFYSVTATSDGIVAVGRSSSFNNGDWTGITGKGLDDAIMVKYDNAGNVVWKKNFGGSMYDDFLSVTAVSDGIVAVGYSGSFNTGDWTGVTGKGGDDAIMVKMSLTPTQYQISASGSNFNVQYYSSGSWVNLSTAQNVAIQTAIDAIRTHSGGNAQITFNGSPLNISGNGISFSSGWSSVKLLGSVSITSSASNIATETIYIGGSVYAESSANVTYVQGALGPALGIAFSNNGTLFITGGTVSSTGSGSGEAILIGGSSANPGKVTISAGTVTSNLANGAIWVGSNGQLEIKGGTITNTANNARAIRTTSTYPVVFNISDSYTFSGGIYDSGAGGVSKEGAGSLYLTGNNTYTGLTTVNQGWLFIGNNTSSGSVAGDINLAGATNCGLIFNRSNAYTYNGIISGPGAVAVWGAGAITFGGKNTYTGSTEISSGGTLVLGATGSIANSSSVGFDGGTLDISATAGATVKRLVILATESGSSIQLGSKTLTIASNSNSYFDGTITGTGGVIKNGTGSLYLIGNNTYTGLTTLNQGGLFIGFDTPTGSIAGNIYIADVNSGVCFFRTTPYTYNGVISGPGSVAVWGAGAITLGGNNTYTYITEISAGGTLILGAGGSIANSSTVLFENGALDISATAGATVKNINVMSYDAGNTIRLGSKTLTIAANSDSFFDGAITGTGGSITKTGTGVLSLDIPAGAATGTITVSQGTLNYAGKWAGNFLQYAGTTFKPYGNVTIGGTLDLRGGTVLIDLSGSSPSKITATGACTNQEITNINISPSAAASNQVLIQAASGVNATNFSLTNTGQSSKLTSNGTQLLLSSNTGIDEVLAAKINIYPNPVKDELRIENGELKIENVEILDLSGKIILNSQFNKRFTFSLRRLFPEIGNR